MRVTNILSDNLIQVDSDPVTIRRALEQNFSRAVRVLMKFVDESPCVICDEFSPKFRTQSGKNFHFMHYHKKETVRFIRDKIMILSPDQIRGKLGGKI